MNIEQIKAKIAELEKSKEGKTDEEVKVIDALISDYNGQITELEKPKTFTQEQMDAIIAERLKRQKEELEKKKTPPKKKVKKKENEEPEDDKTDEEIEKIQKEIDIMKNEAKAEKEKLILAKKRELALTYLTECIQPELLLPNIDLATFTAETAVAVVKELKIKFPRMFGVVKHKGDNPLKGDPTPVEKNLNEMIAKGDNILVFNALTKE